MHDHPYSAPECPHHDFREVRSAHTTTRAHRLDNGTADAAGILLSLLGQRIQAAILEAHRDFQTFFCFLPSAKGERD